MNFLYLRDGYETRKRTYRNPDRKVQDCCHSGGAGDPVGLCDGHRYSGIRASDGPDDGDERCPLAEIVTTVPAPKTTVLTRIKSGMASWYGSVLQGHLTASGRRFNMYELTAAHRTLPFGSRVKVTDLRNHRSVVVTITDRGSSVPGAGDRPVLGSGEGAEYGQDGRRPGEAGADYRA